jgi:choline dehydrogenase-like flavoprotein
VTVIDLERLEGDATEIEADVCIVGSGAAGLALAQALVPTSLSVVVLEGGGRRREPSSDDLYQIETTGTVSSGQTGTRFRVYGGSTTAWGGQALPLAAHVFGPRAWIRSDWPIARSELEPHFGAAEHVMRVGHLPFDADIWELTGTSPPPVDRTIFPVQFSKWSPQPHMGENAWPLVRSSPHLRLFLHANLVGVELSRDRASVDAFVARSLNGRKLRVRLRVGVLACGGVETARLLLACETNDGDPWMADAPAAGHWFHDHLFVRLAEVHPHDPQDFADYFENFLVDEVKYAPRLPLARAVQEREETTDVGCVVLFETDRPNSVAAAKAAMRRLRTREVSAALGSDSVRTIRGLPDVLRAAYRLRTKGRIANASDSRFVIAAQMEQVAGPANRIRLSSASDALGLKRVIVESSITPIVRHTALTFLEHLETEFGRAGIGRLERADAARASAAEFPSYLSTMKHHMGGTRMGLDPSESVVDADLRTHTFENLYLGSTSVYPTGGYSNPTFTLLALMYRLAEHLGTRLGATRRAVPRV